MDLELELRIIRKLQSRAKDPKVPNGFLSGRSNLILKKVHANLFNGICDQERLDEPFFPQM